VARKREKPESTPLLVEEIERHGGLDDAGTSGLVQWRDVRRWIGPRRSGIGLAVCLALTLAALVIARHPQPDLAVPAPRSESPAAPVPSAPSATPGLAVPVGSGTAVALALTNGLLFVLTENPARLVRVVTEAPSVLDSVVTPTGANVLVYDGDWLWVVAPAGSGSVVRAYDQNTLAVVASATVDFAVASAAASAGQLWMGGDGLWSLTTAAKSATRVAGVGAGVLAVAADPWENQILAFQAPPVPSAQTTLISVSTVTSRVLRRVTIPMVKASIEVTAAQVWVAGYGRHPGQALHLDPLTLQPLATGLPDGVQTGPGAAVWPGESIVWVGVDNGDGSSSLLCVDPGTGRIRGRWPGVSGPVVSMPTRAYAIDGAAVVPLDITRTCFPG
jgi:hypothetical protein